MAFFFYKDQLESPTNKTAQGHLKEIILGELLEVWLGGPKRDIFLTKKKKKKKNPFELNGKRKHVGLENIPFYDIPTCESRSERMVHCYYFTPFLGLHG